ncbi:hypothetical protein VTK56DRAFT_3450 [Thermocarpiscus australiensis]
MAPRREILDSEDDGSDFGEGLELADADAHPDSDAPHSDAPEAIDASHNTSASTNPSFFQRIYDEQQAAADAQESDLNARPVDAAVSTWTEVSSAPPPGQRPQAKGSSSLTSVTDPATETRKSRRDRRVRQTEVIDLTDITTPGKEAASGSTDVWDIPSSTRPQRATRTYEKRKMAGQPPSSQQEATPGMPPTQDPYAFPDTTPRSRKTTRRGTPSSSAEQAQYSSPMLTVPTVLAGSSTRQTRGTRANNRNSNIDSSMPDTATSLYIAPSTLTRSQKQEYEVVSPSSQPVPEVPEPSLSKQLLGAGEMHKSSGVTTIAYPTPSRFRSSRHIPERTDEPEKDAAPTDSPLRDANQQQSSPDVLTDMSTTNAAKAKRRSMKTTLSEDVATSELEPPATRQKAKKRKIVQEADDSWALDPLGEVQRSSDGPQQGAREGQTSGLENCTALRDSDTKSQPPIPGVEPVHVNLDESANAPPPEPASKKNKGRKGKRTKAKEPIPDRKEPTPLAEDNPEPTAAAAEVSEPPAKRKRGRPRRSQTTEAAATQAQPQPVPALEPAEDVRADADAAEPNNNNAPSPQPLSEFSANSQPSAADTKANGGGGGGGSGSDCKENVQPAEPALKEATSTKEKKKQAVIKPGVLNQKVQYRVGLSKKSRIAPLLKSLKKN